MIYPSPLLQPKFPLFFYIYECKCKNEYSICGEDGILVQKTLLNPHSLEENDDFNIYNIFNWF